MNKITIILTILLLLLTLQQVSAVTKPAIINIQSDIHSPRFNNQNPEELVQYWERHIRSLGLTGDRIDYPNRSADLEKYDLVIIPGSTSLTAQQTDVLLKYVYEGGNLILCEAAGAKVSDMPFNRNSLAQSLKLNYKHIPVSVRSSWKIMLQTPEYLTSGIPRMQLIDVEANNGVIVTTTLHPSAFWINPDERNDDLSYWEKSAALVKGKHGEGRFIWMGFSATAVGGDLNNAEAFYRLSQNMISWFEKKTVVEKNAWPKDYKGALTFSMDTETAFSNINRMLSIDGLTSVTFFILTNPAHLYHELLRNIASGSNEVAVMGELAVHGDSHDVFKGMSLEKQMERLGGIKEFFRNEIGADVVGFRPPEEAYDYFTLEALAKTGYVYMFADDSSDRAEPKIINVANEYLVQIPMLNKDDIKLIMMPGLTDTEQIYNNYIKDINQVINREGLYMANFHTHVLVNRDNLPVLERLKAYVNSSNIWVETVRNVANWWKDRESIRIYKKGDIGDSSSQKEIIVAVENIGDIAMSDISYSVWFPHTIRSLRVNNSADSRQNVSYRIDGERLRINVPKINGNEAIEYQILWQE